MRDSRLDVLNFWFTETEPCLWFQDSADFDALVRDRCTMAYDLARAGLCDAWSTSVEGSLALCLLLHQVPRNIFRGTAKMFATDGQAVLTAKQAITRGFDQTLEPARRRFLYLPLMESETLANQRRSVELFGRMAKDDPLSYEHARRNFEIVRRFGRFPARNAILKRESTVAEDLFFAAAVVVLAERGRSALHSVPGFQAPTGGRSRRYSVPFLLWMTHQSKRVLIIN